MMSDFIPVYFPGRNVWSIPTFEVVHYVDYKPVPQTLGLAEGSKIEGIPLLHFGAKGSLGVNITARIREFARKPEETARKYCEPEDVARVAAFFKRLVAAYPDLVNVTEYDGPTETSDNNSLFVPDECIVLDANVYKPDFPGE